AFTGRWIGLSPLQSISPIRPGRIPASNRCAADPGSAEPTVGITKATAAPAIITEADSQQACLRLHIPTLSLGRPDATNPAPTFGHRHRPDKHLRSPRHRHLRELPRKQLALSRY